MKVVRWLLPLVSLLIVAVVTLWDLGGARMGPGPLHSAHRGVATLDQGSRCEACHRPGEGIDPVGCNACHQAIAAQFASGNGLHGSLSAGLRDHCDVCHSDHHGDTAPLLAEHAFQLAGFPARDAYDHRHVVYALTDAHVGLACGKCHLAADDTVPPTGGRFLGLTQSCTECHDDVHRGAFGADCESCHGQKGPWTALPGFDHAAFPLRAAHRRVECVACHAAGSGHDVASLQQMQARHETVAVRTCAVCHVDPHGASSAGANAAASTLRLANTSDCARCHEATTWAAARPTVDAHGAFGWPLRGEHATTACAECHGDATRPARWTREPPPLAACAACHEHPHQGQLVATAVAATGPSAGCAGCHEDADADFRAGRMDAAQHAATGFALQAPHADVACAKCHAPELVGQPWSARFPGRSPADCRGCHQDVHAGQFDHEPGYRQCTACHLATAFHPAQFSVAQHGKTAFPLTGAHDAVACTACHVATKDGVRAFHGTTQQCDACHQDVHAGAFDRAGRPKAVGGKAGCARCHDTAAFAPVAGTFDHALWAGYELTGAHARVDCSKCHPRTERGPKNASRLGRAAGTSCASCHSDPHAGQFTSRTATDCKACHDTTSFRITAFDHAATRFPLDDVHEAIACSKCHLTYESKLGKVVRYKPLGTACGDCHKLGSPAGGRR